MTRDEIIEQAALIINAARVTEPFSAPMLWARDLYEAGMLVPPATQRFSVSDPAVLEKVARAIALYEGDNGHFWQAYTGNAQAVLNALRED